MNYLQFTAEELANEIWLPCVQDDRYEVSNLGRVKRVKATKQHPVTNGVLKPQQHGNGYRAVTFVQNGQFIKYSVHQLICRAFHGKPSPNQTDVNHRDHDRTNNRSDNLHWCTRKENLQWAKQHGRNNHGSRNGQAKLKESDALQIIHLLKTTTRTHFDIASQFNVTDGAVQLINRGHRWQNLLNRENMTEFPIQQCQKPKR